MTDWQTYVRTLVDSGKVKKAAIVGQNGGVWAISDGFQLPPDEENVVTSAFKDPSTQASGLKLDGQRFFSYSSNDRSVYLKRGANGAILRKTHQAILVALYESPSQAGDTVPIVEATADLMVANGL